jgi:hypothetical protein
MKYYASLTAEVASKELENIELRKNLLVKGGEVYVQQVSLPQRKTSPKVGLVVVWAMLIALLVILIKVSVQKFLAIAMQDSKSAAKLLMIRHFLRK